MKYNGTIYRPPVEARTFLLPITEGCTHNSCTFCNMFQNVPFRMLSASEVEESLQEARQNYSRCRSLRVVRQKAFGADRTHQTISAERRGFHHVCQDGQHRLQVG